MSESPRRVHFVAVGGTGMGSLAGLLRARGIEVTGSDVRLYPPMSTALERWDIPVFEEFAAEHVLEHPPDLVVIGNAVGPDNPAARAAIDEGLAYVSFPDALYRHAIAGRHSVVVAGTHGKTTTTSLVAALLLGTGRDPSMLVGGFPLDFDGSFREGQGEHFVVEGDEYDTAFFDKTPKFLHYGARTLLVTSVEFDHADIYRDLDHVKQAFRELVAGLPCDGVIVAARDHAGVRDVIAEAPCRSVGYGLEAQAPGDWCAADLEASTEGTSCDVVCDGRKRLRARVEGYGFREPALWRVSDVAFDEEGTDFTLWKGERRMSRIHLPLHGRHNVENALGAVAVCDSLGVDPGRSAEALEEFQGVRRRQELRGDENGFAVIDDFAHHPTAVRETIAATRASHPDRKLWAVFEPRTNTSRRRYFEAELVEALSGADAVILARVFRPEQIPEEERLRPEWVVSELAERGLEAKYLPEVDEIIDHLARSRTGSDVALIMSNGGFGGIWDRLLARLKQSS